MGFAPFLARGGIVAQQARQALLRIRDHAAELVAMEMRTAQSDSPMREEDRSVLRRQNQRNRNEQRQEQRQREERDNDVERADDRVFMQLLARRARAAVRSLIGN
ncbi:MAG TPA: hypothetical protein VHC42_11980 [Rhizomicrobium sp.]|nr:hypothetical protein [Rhizomicrobium sp.]